MSGIGTFAVDAGATGAGRGTWDPFVDAWNDRMGALYPLPEFTPGTVDGFRGTMRSVTLKDAAINEFRASSPVSTQTVGTQEQDQVRVYVGLRGALALEDPHGHGGDAHVGAGTYFVHHCARENHFRSTPGIGARIFVLPGDDLRHLVGGRPRAGRAGAPAARILMAFAGTLQHTVAGLGPDGARASRNALHELVKGLILDHVDDREPAFAPALAQAARDLAETRLTSAGLTTAAIAAHLHVSVRTLQRAFPEESLTAYVRRRRLEEAARALLAPGPRPTASQAAAIWQFTDGSHFIRCFKAQFHTTPAEFARLHGPR